VADQFFRGGSVSFGFWSITTHFGSRLVLAQTLVDHLAQQIVAGPGKIFHLDDQLGPDPMGAALRRDSNVRYPSFAENAHLAVNRPSACSGVKALPNTSAARRQGAKLC